MADEPTNARKSFGDLAPHLRRSLGDCRSFNEGGSRSVGADSNLFHRGAAKESDDPDFIAAIMAKRGVVLRRPVGSTGSFELCPTARRPGWQRSTSESRSQFGAAQAESAAPVDRGPAQRKAAPGYEQEERSRKREQAREEAARQKEFPARDRYVSHEGVRT